jgi:hypothetical protein
MERGGLSAKRLTHLHRRAVCRVFGARGVKVMVDVSTPRVTMGLG